METPLHTITPRNITSSILQQRVSLQGIITKCSQIRPLLQTAVQFCSFDNSLHTHDLTNADALVQLPSKTIDNKPLELEPGLSTYRDFQTLVVQETPESAPTGQMPRSVVVILLNDLVDRGKPGDRVVIVGMLRAIAGPNHSSTFKVVLQAESIDSMQSEGPQITDYDKENIKKILKGDIKPIDLLSQSIAPSIYGYREVKKAMVLQLVGATPKIRLRSRVRGDIHVMLCGDPSTAKSQLLRYIMHVAPLAVSTNGRGATGVGLTAAVVNDPDTNQRTLEAGAMVLADRGIVCVDEFDKMSMEDRAAMHEVMEQQTVTVQKAGIHTSLNARCSILAAANPTNGNYIVSKSPMENLKFPESLLSRFDLIFIVLDSSTKEVDQKVCEHVLKMHRFTSAILQKEMNDELDFFSVHDTGKDVEGNTQVYQDTALYDKEKLLTNKFIKKFIMYVKSLPTPKLTPEADEKIAEAYVKLRESEREKRAKHNFKKQTLPITARALDSLIRLSEASARVRGSDVIEAEDAECAIGLVFYANFDEEWDGKLTTDVARRVREYLIIKLVDEGNAIINFSEITEEFGIEENEIIEICKRSNFRWSDESKFVYLND